MSRGVILAFAPAPTDTGSEKASRAGSGHDHGPRSRHRQRLVPAGIAAARQPDLDMCLLH